MKQITKIFKDLENFDLPRDTNAYDKLKCGELTIGKRIHWYYEEDKKFYEDECEDIKNHLKDCYSGICIPVPGFENNHGEIDVEQIIVIVDNYPVEKCYPEVDWVALKRLLDDKRLVEILD
jgi:hypothetical protein